MDTKCEYLCQVYKSFDPSCFLWYLLYIALHQTCCCPVFSSFRILGVLQNARPFKMNWSLYFWILKVYRGSSPTRNAIILVVTVTEREHPKLWLSFNWVAQALPKRKCESCLHFGYLACRVLTLTDGTSTKLHLLENQRFTIHFMMKLWTIK